VGQEHEKPLSAVCAREAVADDGLSYTCLGTGFLFISFVRERTREPLVGSYIGPAL
jgi:hypothetical protein